MIYIDLCWFMLIYIDSHWYRIDWFIFIHIDHVASPIPWFTPSTFDQSNCRLAVRPLQFQDHPRSNFFDHDSLVFNRPRGDATQSTHECIATYCNQVLSFRVSSHEKYQAMLLPWSTILPNKGCTLKRTQTHGLRPFPDDGSVVCFALQSWGKTTLLCQRAFFQESLGRSAKI